MTDLNDNLPPGWECKIDDKTGKFYFINHYTRTTSWDDPRMRHRPLQSTPRHITNMSSEYIPLQEFRSTQRSSPLTVRSNRVQDSSMTILPDSDDAVAKINTMFPTVSETHIRMLMKNCRYMKSIFPQAEETVILEILQNNDNNIQKTSDVLKDMGFNKKDTVKAAQQKLEAKREEEEKVEEAKAEKVATPVPVLKTAEEKETMKNKLKEKYKDVPDHLIKIALESVHFDESRAAQILQIMVQEDNERNDQVNAVNNEEQELVVEIESSSMPTAIPISQSRMSIKSLLKSEKTDKDKTLFNRIIENDGNFKSPYLSNTTGPTYGNAKGPNEELLLEDYVKWQGTNLNHRKGPQGLAKGSDKSLLSARSYKPQGANLELRKGPKLSLAKGSIFSQLKTVFESESRGK